MSTKLLTKINEIKTKDIVLISEKGYHLTLTKNIVKQFLIDYWKEGGKSTVVLCKTFDDLVKNISKILDVELTKKEPLKVIKKETKKKN